MKEQSSSKVIISPTTAILSIVVVSSGFAVMVGPFLAPAFRKLTIPWMATPTNVIRNALNKLPQQKNPISNRKLVDLGSGDGRFVIEAAKAGYKKAVGIELNPWLVAYSYWKSWRAGVFNKTTFKMINFFDFDLRPFDVITCFGANGVMEPLCTKIKEEGKDDVLIVCYRFPLIDKVPIVKDGELFIYCKKDI